MSGCPPMDRALSSFILGGCVFGTAYVAQRTIAPFAGLSLTLFTCVLAAALVGFSLGCALGAAARPPERGGPLATRVLLAAAACTLVAAALHRPLLVALSGLELRLVVGIAAAALAGVPCFLVGFAFAASAGEASATGVLRQAAWLLAGAALAAPLVGYVLVPRLGVTLALASLGAAEAIAAALLGVRRSPLATAAGVLAVLGGAAFVATRPVAAVRIGPRMLELRQGASAEYRV